MTSRMINILPCNVRPIKDVDSAKYVCFKSFVNWKVCARPANIVCNCRHSIMSATNNWSTKKTRTTDEQLESTMVADNLACSAPMPPKPATSSGNPLTYSFPANRRPRVNKSSPAFQGLEPANFVYPLFIHEGRENLPVEEMPGCYRLSGRGLYHEVKKAREFGVNRFMLIPEVKDLKKSRTGDEAFNDMGIVPWLVRRTKISYPDIEFYTDLTLEPYMSDGYIVTENVWNDETVHKLCKHAVVLARAGVDVLRPTGKMDGLVGAIRDALDVEGFQYVAIMAYASKYKSSFYGPSRDVYEAKLWAGNKRYYQRNPSLVEMREDKVEGANTFLVSPGLPCLDIIRFLHDKSSTPIAAYQVPGEYSMIKAGGAVKMIDEERVMMESLMCIRRAGADTIITHFALEAARYLCG